MTLRFKQMIYGTMILVILLGIFSGYWVKGILLLVMVNLGIYMVEVRQARRYTMMILNKLYVCLDIEVYDEMVEALKQSLVLPHMKKQAALFFTLMKSIHKSHTESHLWESLNKWYVLDLWRVYAKVALDDLSDQKRIEKSVSKYQQDYLALMVAVKQILKESEQTQKASLLALRSKAENNLQFAWINLLISKQEEDPRMKAYYKRIANNIAPHLLEIHCD